MDAGKHGAYYVLYATEGGSDPRSPEGRGRSAAQNGGSLPPFWVFCPRPFWGIFLAHLVCPLGSCVRAE